MSGNGAQRRLGVFAVPPAAYRMPTICRVGLRANNTAALHRGRLGSRARTPAVGAATDRARRAPVRPRGGAELRRPHGECLPSARRHVRVLPPMMDDKRRRRVGRRTLLPTSIRAAQNGFGSSRCRLPCYTITAAQAGQHCRRTPPAGRLCRRENAFRIDLRRWRIAIRTDSFGKSGSLYV